MCVVGYNDGWNEFLSKESLSCLKVSLAILWYSALLSNGGCSSPADSCNRVIISLLSDWHRDWKIVRDDAVRGRQQSLGRFVWSTDTFILCDFQKQILGFGSAQLMKTDDIKSSPGVTFCECELALRRWTLTLNVSNVPLLASSGPFAQVVPLLMWLAWCVSTHLWARSQTF